MALQPLAKQKPPQSMGFCKDCLTEDGAVSAKVWLPTTRKITRIGTPSYHVLQNCSYISIKDAYGGIYKYVYIYICIPYTVYLFHVFMANFCPSFKRNAENSLVFLRMRRCIGKRCASCVPPPQQIPTIFLMASQPGPRRPPPEIRV